MQEDVERFVRVERPVGLLRRFARARVRLSREVSARSEGGDAAGGPCEERP